MKKKLLCALSLGALLIVGCDTKPTTSNPKNDEPEETVHEHTFSKKYKYDEEFHWLYATCHPEEKKNYGPHDFGEVEIDKMGQTYRMCIVCRFKQYIDSGLEGFSNVTEFPEGTELNIHTDYQRNFLAYADNTYDKMPQNSYPEGAKNLSDPVKTKITWQYRNHSTDVTYFISISQNEGMEDSFQIFGTNEQEIEVYNWYLGKNYYTIHARKPSGEVDSSKVYSVNVTNDYIRNLYVGSKMTNCRDIGGKTIFTGGTIKQGLLYRTCGNGYNQDGKKIDDEGQKIMLDQLKVKTELNLHNNSSYDFNFTGTTKYATLMDYADGSPSKNVFSRNAESVKNVFEILAKEECYPVFFHDRNSVDRTGLIAILLNGVLGVSLNDIYQDYLFSNFGKIGSKRKIGTNEADDIYEYIKEIKELPGESFNEQCYNTLLTIGVPQSIISKILSIFIVGEKPNYDNDQRVFAAKDMTVSGTRVLTEYKSTLTERNYPSSYCTMSTGATVKATFALPVPANGSKTAYIYVGNNDASTTKMINEAITAKIDDRTISIPSISFKDAGMGYCSGNRINFYFVKLGDLGTLATGQHTIEITGEKNDLILGNIAVF